MRMCQLTYVRSLAHSVTYKKYVEPNIQPTKIVTARHIKNWFVIINAHNGKQKQKNERKMSKTQDELTDKFTGMGKKSSSRTEHGE